MLTIGIILFVLGCAILFAHTCLLSPLIRVENLQGFIVFLIAVALITVGGWIATDRLVHKVMPTDSHMYSIRHQSYRGVI